MSYHGANHALSVAVLGFDLAAETLGADTEVILAFAYLHDIERRNEDEDPEHPKRAAEHAWATPGLDDEQRIKLYVAIRDHAEGHTHSDPTIGCCWDADRLTLGRVGIIPDPEFLSTAAGRRRAA